jgi:hypothetical protein
MIIQEQSIWKRKWFELKKMARKLSWWRNFHGLVTRIVIQMLKVAPHRPRLSIFPIGQSDIRRETSMTTNVILARITNSLFVFYDDKRITSSFAIPPDIPQIHSEAQHCETSNRRNEYILLCTDKDGVWCEDPHWLKNIRIESWKICH